MPRPLRIEYEDAYYHVMNRGRSRQNVFHGARYYEAFLAILSESHQRFGLEVLCYCLMDNHYHLLVKTREANLGRAMRHINGVYTQRHNRMKKTDGPLFRGRYKAICVEEDSYQLQLSRYIHRNPIEAGMVKRLEDHPWSSYGYFIRRQPPPDWLFPQAIFDQLNVKTRIREKYRAYVEQGIDEELASLYNKGNQVPYLGSDEFRQWAYAQRETDEMEITRQTRQHFRPGIAEIIESVAKQFKVSSESMLISQRGRVPNNIPRWVGMYMAQEYGAMTLKEIAGAFGLKRGGSIPTTIKKLLLAMEKDKKLLMMVSKLKRRYDA